MRSTMKLAIAGDSAGAPLALALSEYLGSDDGLIVSEVSVPQDGGPELYAHLAERVCKAVLEGVYDRAILVCGTGIGVCISANKVPGIRAALAHDAYSAAKASTSNNAQIITMGARVIGVELAKTIANAWLSAGFDENGPSAANVQAINSVDRHYKSQ